MRGIKIETLKYSKIFMYREEELQNNLTGLHCKYLIQYDDISYTRVIIY